MNLNNESLLLRLLVLAAFISVLALSQASAAPKLNLAIGKSASIPATGVKKILMVKEGVVDVLNVSDDEIIISGIGTEGASTQIIIWDSKGKRIIDVDTFAENKLLHEKFKTLLGNSGAELVIFHDEIYLNGKVASLEEKERVEKLAKSLVKNKHLISLLEIAPTPIPLKERIETALMLPSVQVTVLSSKSPLVSQEQIANFEIPQTIPGTDTADLRVLLHGTVKDQNDYIHLCETIKAFIPEDKVSNLVTISDPIQVVFQAYILQVSKNNTNDLGITWGSEGSDGVVAGSLLFKENKSDAYRGDEKSFGPPITKSWNPLKMNNINRFDLIAAQVEAWETKGKAKVIASPKLIVYANSTPTKLTQSSWKSEGSSGSESEVSSDAALAYVNIGQQIYYAKGIDQAGSPIYDSVEASLKLSIRDMFVTDDQLKFSVFAQQAEPNFLRGSSAPPDIMTRSIMTTLKIKNQETIVLGGLINKTQSTSYKGVPGLSRIPLIGKAFRSKSVNVSENEMIILLTPKIDNREEDKAANVKFEQIPVPNRNERLELLNQAFKRIKSGHTSKGEQR